MLINGSYVNGQYVEFSPAEKYEILRAHARFNYIKGPEIIKMGKMIKVGAGKKAKLGVDSTIEILYEIGRLLNELDYPPRR